MREILFRGKRIDNGEWITGDLWNMPYADLGVSIVNFFIDTGTTGGLRVIPETIGQYTGWDDKNGVKIFEGDIVKATQKGQTKNGVVVYREGSYFWEFETDQYGYLGEVVKRWHPEVIGNVTDNQELMEWE